MIFQFLLYRHCYYKKNNGINVSFIQWVYLLNINTKIYEVDELRSGTPSSLGNSAITRNNGDLGKAETWIGQGRDFGQSFHTQPQRIENVSENAITNVISNWNGCENATLTSISNAALTLISNATLTSISNANAALTLISNATLGPLHGGGGVYLYHVFPALQGGRA